MSKIIEQFNNKGIKFSFVSGLLKPICTNPLTQDDIHDIRKYKAYIIGELAGVQVGNPDENKQKKQLVYQIIEGLIRIGKYTDEMKGYAMQLLDNEDDCLSKTQISDMKEYMNEIKEYMKVIQGQSWT